MLWSMQGLVMSKKQKMLQDKNQETDLRDEQIPLAQEF